MAHTTETRFRSHPCWKRQGAIIRAGIIQRSAGYRDDERRLRNEHFESSNRSEGEIDFVSRLLDAQS